MTNRTRVALIFGGRSSEHGISCLTAASVLDGGGNPITLSNATKADADLDMSAATVDTAEALENNWALIGRIAVDASGVHAYCYGDLQSAAVPFILRISQKR